MLNFHILGLEVLKPLYRTGSVLVVKYSKDLLTTDSTCLPLTRHYLFVGGILNWCQFGYQDLLNL